MRLAEEFPMTRDHNFLIKRGNSTITYNLFTHLSLSLNLLYEVEILPSLEYLR